MAILKRNLGNRMDIIIQKFRENHSDGLGSLAFDNFCDGWKAAWDECKEQLGVENEKLMAWLIEERIPIYCTGIGCGCGKRVKERRARDRIKIRASITQDLKGE